MLASGSEVSLAVEAQKALANEGIHVSVVSMPSWDRFEAQTADYKESVIPKHVKNALQLKWAHLLVGSDIQEMKEIF